MPCADKNPLIREGTSLLNRVLAALSVDYAKVDERDAADIILFAKRYATCLNYYNNNNIVDGNWQALMRMDVSVTLATLARIDTREISDYKKRLFKRIRMAGDDPTARENLRFLFDVMFSLVTLIDEQFKLLPAEFEYKAIFNDLISSKLQYPLANLENWFEQFKSEGLLDYTANEPDNDSPIDVISNENFTRADLSTPWHDAAADIAITLPSTGTVKDKVVYVTNHNLFAAQIDSLLTGIATIVSRANTLFVDTLENFPKHSPHYALFLAFVKLFAQEQEALNAYTKKHLDFYYKEVLRLTNKAPIADEAHLLFELQKPVKEHRLTKNTLFKGGKDVTGKEISYTLLEDIVLNKAVVSKLYSTQIIHGAKDLLKASPIANSDDGQGAQLSSADKSWFTFGDVKKIKNAQAGFAIVSNVLFMNEGRRTITITASFASPIPALVFCNLNCFTAQYTGAKKWIDAPNPSVTTNPATNQLTFSITLSPDDPALVAYDESIHASGLGISMPVLKLYLNQDIANGIPYTLLCRAAVSKLSVSVDVSGVKDLMLSNDNGSIDASRPFKPFGDFPENGAGFYIGSKEVFQKNLTVLEINTSWKTPASGPSVSGTAKYLRQSAWHNLSMSSTSTKKTINFSGGNTFTPTAIDFGKNEQLLPTTVEGFLRLQLVESQYSLSNHLIRVSTALSNGTSIVPDGSGSFNIKVAATPTPNEVVLETLSLNYKAAIDIPLNTIAANGNHQLLHLAPFGFSPVNNSLTDTSGEAENITAVSLLRDVRNEGELFIGVENAEPKQVLNILFQVAEGSSNPLRNIADLRWFYLSTNNNWKRLKEETLVDRTKNFTQSGIVTFTLPADAINNGTLLNPGFHWIKVSVRPYTDAVCKMIQIRAQAARVQLVQHEEKQIEYRQLLPANTISKPVISDGAIKKIEQPFDSFNGRTRETDDHFYIRVSERLRHKQRAISIWDYEHIALEKFPELFKVKCINHAGFYPKGNEEVFCENYPGHVTVITIPKLNNATTINPLRPYTSLGLLTNIYDYLKTIVSPFVRLHVKNPQFEEIQLDFKVKFHDNLSESFYLQLLNTEIEQFLCPWAFNNQQEISFGGKIYKSAILNFVEERPYVDFVTCFKMNHIINRNTAGTKVLLDVDEAVASTARSILVSYYDEDTNTRHLIQSPASCTC